MVSGTLTIAATRIRLRTGTVCGQAVQSRTDIGGKSLWIVCRKPAATAVESAGMQRWINGSVMPCPAVDKRWIFCRSNSGQNERDRALGAPGPKMPPEIGDYFSELLMVSKFELSLLPRPLTAVMIAIEMPAAIRPYSMAVAPDSSFKNDLMSDFMAGSNLGLSCLEYRVPPAVPVREPTGMNLRLP